MMTSLFKTMQRKFMFTGLALLVLAATSCKKMLDPDPKDVILSEDFQRIIGMRTLCFAEHIRQCSL